jgi:Family of unknown function (DUF6206)
MTTAPAFDKELTAFERRLDPRNPGAAGASVIGYGEVSVALRLGDLPGYVCKRMSGFTGRPGTDDYTALLDEYLEALAGADIDVVRTEAVVVDRSRQPPVVYLVQPELPGDSLGHQLLRTADEGTVAGCVEQVLDAVARLHVASTRGDRVEVAVDGQLSNWSFVVPGRPVLVDVGTPFLRRDGRHALDLELLHRPVPPGIRAYYRRRGEVRAYLDEYFDPRLVAVDLLGNFHKEGRPDRIPFGVEVVNQWFARHGDAAGPGEPVTVDEVERYYRKDADLLALYLRLRKADRFVRTRVLRQGYDYVLPEQVDR